MFNACDAFDVFDAFDAFDVFDAFDAFDVFWRLMCVARQLCIMTGLGAQHQWNERRRRVPTTADQAAELGVFERDETDEERAARELLSFIKRHGY